MNGKRYTLSGQRTADEYSLPIDSGNTPALIIQRKNFRLLIPFFHTHTVSVRQPLTGRLTVFQYRKRIFSHKNTEFQVSCAKNFHFNPYKKRRHEKIIPWPDSRSSDLGRCCKHTYSRRLSRLFRTTRRYQYYATAFVPLRQRQTEQNLSCCRRQSHDPNHSGRTQNRRQSLQPGLAHP